MTYSELPTFSAAIDQISSTNIGAIVTVRFNVASFEANVGDWGWVLAGVDPTFDVQDANAFINNSGSSAVYTRFSEGCWFYFGQAAVLGKPFLCSRDPDAELSALQSSTLNEPYQYGSLEFYSAASGNLSIWYAIDEQFDFAMVHNYYTCGINLNTPASLVVRLSLGVAVADPMCRSWLWSLPSVCCPQAMLLPLLLYTSFERLAITGAITGVGVAFSAALHSFRVSQNLTYGKTQKKWLNLARYFSTIQRPICASLEAHTTVQCLGLACA